MIDEYGTYISIGDILQYCHASRKARMNHSRLNLKENFDFNSELESFRKDAVSFVEMIHY